VNPVFAIFEDKIRVSFRKENHLSDMCLLFRSFV